ncbi:Cytochrome b561 [Dyella jiangningensis]|uniref:cytochrome b n=2 Tax=Gammaproteobacteria TaxID=1236 RepID=UPI00088E469B|nr:cytochrome b [Dyella sp. AtDHG13]PXV61543.1 cytochrome b561 [Dyella sp. AtDHG13]SDJ72055.1 Cytochrome b561 [Dyella jiangningensis]
MNTPKAFHPLARLLHWTMAVLILAMLFIGVGMVSTVSGKHTWLLALHKPLGALIFILALIRLGVRLRFPPPPLPDDMPALMRFVAHASHWLLYALMLALPLVGWAMLSAGGYPISLGGSVHLPPILAANGETFAWLREAHRYLAYLLFVTVLGHMGAALYHGLIRRDDVLPSMTFPSSSSPHHADELPPP